MDNNNSFPARASYGSDPEYVLPLPDLSFPVYTPMSARFSGTLLSDRLPMRSAPYRKPLYNDYHREDHLH